MEKDTKELQLNWHELGRTVQEGYLVQNMRGNGDNIGLKIG